MTEPSKKFYDPAKGALPPRPAFDASLPVISVITPTYNYGRFLERCIRSILCQTYPNIEYHIIDGGSSDSTVEIIKRYEDYGITSWTSEADKGQTDAINKGFNRCKGDIFIWLNADDAFSRPDILDEVAKHFREGVQFLVGEIERIHTAPDGQIQRTKKESSAPVSFEQFLHYWKYPCLPQPAVFVERSIAQKAFPLSTDLRLIMDYQFFLRCLAQDPKSVWIDTVCSDFYQHDTNASCSAQTPDYSVWDREFSEVFRAEAARLPKDQQAVFQRQLDRHLQLSHLLHTEATRIESLTSGLRHPALFGNLLFWKLFIKSMLGKALYERIRMPFK